jgi:hypothetical protein
MNRAVTAALAVVLLATGGLAGAADPAAGQDVGLGATHGTTSKGDVPGGPGMRAWTSYDLLSVFRLEASAGRQWGREHLPAPFCVGGFEGPSTCVDEDGRRFATITSGELSVLAMTPPWRGVRLGLGLTRGVYGYDVGRESLETGWLETPAEGRKRTVFGGGWRALAELRPGDGPVSIRLGYRAYDVDFGACVMDAWSLCRDASFRAVSLGAAYRLF